MNDCLECAKLKAEVAESKEHVAEACAARDQWRSTSIERDTLTSALRDAVLILMARGCACSPGDPRCTKCLFLTKLRTQFPTLLGDEGETPK